ncbi:MAG: hypothetical protein JWP75_511 [Frondihabitans sp.]|nr:hypothetical protein [Frondihabitans sp.]
MSDAPELTVATQQFINDMTAAGAPAWADGPRILYDVIAVGGALVGQTVTTGVSISEVQSWPMVPPHWIHLPKSIMFSETNADEIDCKPGWKRHSRNYGYTDTSVPPALEWLRHVRGFISIAIPRAA